MTDSIFNLTIEEFTDLIRSVVRDELSKKIEQDQEGQLLSPAETANLFTPRVSTQTLTNYCRRGVLTKHRLGRRVYFKRSEVLSAIHSLTPKSANHGN